MNNAKRLRVIATYMEQNNLSAKAIVRLREMAAIIDSAENLIASLPPDSDKRIFRLLEQLVYGSDECVPTIG